VASGLLQRQLPRPLTTTAKVVLAAAELSGQGAVSGSVGGLNFPSGVPSTNATLLPDGGHATHAAVPRPLSAPNLNPPIESRDSRVSLATPQLQGAADVSSSLVAGVMGDGLLRAVDRTANKVAGSRTVGGLDATMGAAGGVIGRAQAPYQIEASAAVVPDTAVAETVSYWVTHGVQNAELRLEGWGDHAVEVSISLQGDQASVDFRTDQPEIRRALEAANGQLRELLSSEGLQLAGLTIGSSGSRDSSNEERPARQQGKVVVNQAESVAVGVVSRSANPAVGRSLDVFV